MRKLRHMVRRLPNIVEERPPGGAARPNGWYPRGKVTARADKRRHPAIGRSITVRQYAHAAR